MKVIFITAVTIIICVLLILKREYRKQLLLAYGLIVICFSAYYNEKLLDTIMTFHRPVFQTFYQMEYPGTGEYPDSLLPLLLSGKKVYTKDDGYKDFEEAEREGRSWLYGFYHMRNTVRYLKFIKAKVEPQKDMNGTMLTGEQIEKDFYNLGPANDMYRYSFLGTDFNDEIGNYFTYYWYYSGHLSEIDVYVNTSPDSKGEDIGTSDELVVLWDSPEAPKEEENFYLMTKTYYEENVR